MFLLRVCLLLLSAALLGSGCDSRPGGVSQEESSMSPEDYDAKIEAEESQRDE